MTRFFIFEQRDGAWHVIECYLNSYAAVADFARITETCVPLDAIAVTVRAGERFSVNTPDGTHRMIVSDERPLLLPHVARQAVAS